MSPGAFYEDKRSYCAVHGGYEMLHTCGGGPGEPMGYCSAWSGEYEGGHLGKDGVTMFGGSPSCRFGEKPDE